MAWVTKDSQETYENNEPVRTYTKAEKAGNWWHYHKWQAVVVIILLVVAAFIIKDTFFRAKPDYQVAYVGLQNLPEDTGTALTEALESFCDDRNGDGQVLVQLNQYAVELESGAETTDAYSQMAGITRLSADLSSSDGSYIFLLENPETFQEYTGALRYLDGTIPEDGESAKDWENMVYRWTDCPVLTGLDLGTCSTYVDDAGNELPNQELMTPVYVAFRGNWNEEIPEAYTADEAIWNTLTAGAVSTVTEE